MFGALACGVDGWAGNCCWLTWLVAGLLALALLAWGAFEALYAKRDARTVRLLTRPRGPWAELEAPSGQRRFAIELPFFNENAAYEQTLLDVRAEVRVLAKGEVAPGALRGVGQVRALNSDGRGDGYWAATLLGARERLGMRLEVAIFGEPETLAHLHAAVVTIHYATYGRRDLLPFSEEIVLPLSAVKPLPEPLNGTHAWIQCVPTPLLTDADDIVEVVDRLTKDFRQPGDIVAVAESVVAVTQRRYRKPEEVTPGYWASRLCYFVPSKGSLSSRHGFQSAINDVGLAKTLFAFFVGAAGKLVGKKGLFYELAGRPAELIDDITGTMPPFDRYIVMGPDAPEQVVAAIQARTGMGAAIVDANDLKRAMVLAATPGLEPAKIAQMVLDNPFGNAAEQTPFVVLRPHGAK